MPSFSRISAPPQPGDLDPFHLYGTGPQQTVSSWKAALVLTSAESAPALDYQRSIVASMIELLEGYLAVLPERPAHFVWNGEAQRRYVEGLALLREELWHVHWLLTEAFSRLGAVHAR